jgi:hypothetical protein
MSVSLLKSDIRLKTKKWVIFPTNTTRLIKTLEHESSKWDGQENEEDRCWSAQRAGSVAVIAFNIDRLDKE